MERKQEAEAKREERREVACDTGNGFTWRDGSIYAARSVRGGEESEVK